MDGKITRIDGNNVFVKLLKIDHYPNTRRPESMMEHLSKYKVDEDDKFITVKTNMTYYNSKNGPIEPGLGIGFNPNIVPMSDAAQIEHCASYTIPEDEETWVNKYLLRNYLRN
jgi:hypothetical protein